MWFTDHPLSERFPSVIKAVLVRSWYFLRGRTPPYRILWKETLWDMAARFIVGLLAGAAFAFLLIPAVFWPGRRTRGRSLYDALRHPDWIGYIFLAAWLGTAVIMMLRTKARLYYVEEWRTDPPML
jgi:hypothetical protein